MPKQINNMKVVILLLAFIFQAAKQGMAQSFCSGTTSVAASGKTFDLAEDCDFGVITIATDNSLRLTLVHSRGVFEGGDFCTIYDRSNNRVIGEFSGPYYNDIPVITTGVFGALMSCNISNSNLTTVVVNEARNYCSQSSINASELPQTFDITTKDMYGNYQPNSWCEMKVSSPIDCTFTLSTPSGVLPNPDSLYIDSDDPNNPVYLLQSPSNNQDGHNGFTMTRTGKSLQLYFVTGSTQRMRQSPVVSISSVCIPPPDIVCSGTVSISFSAESLNLLSVENEDMLYIAAEVTRDLATLPEKCKALPSDPVFTFNLTECEPALVSGDDTQKYLYKVRNLKHVDTSSSIKRIEDYTLDVSCNFTNSKSVSSVEIKPEINNIGTALPSFDGDFTVTLELSDTNDFSMPLAANSEITIPDLIYAKVSLSDIPDGIDEFILDMENCFATDEGDTDDLHQYSIIEDSCLANNTFEEVGARTLTRNRAARFGLFNLKAFRWSHLTDNQQAIYVHCMVKICYNGDGQCPSLNCETDMTRRSIESFHEKMITAGPLIVSTIHTKGDGRIPNDDMHEPDGKTRVKHMQNIFVASLALFVIGILFLIWRKL